MRIHVTKDEFDQMAVNCHEAECINCLLNGICRIEEGKNFTEFIQGVDCYNPHKQVLNNGETYG